jgi:hypothetical protein
MTNESMSLALMLKLLEVVRESGANSREAACALKAAEAFLPEMGLRAPGRVIRT